MKLNAEIDVKTRSGAYKTYKMTFENKRHYDNWVRSIETKWGGKIIGERWENNVSYDDIDTSVSEYIAAQENAYVDNRYKG